MKNYLVSCVTVQGISLKPEEDSPQAVQQGQPSQLPSPGAARRAFPEQGCSTRRGESAR